MSIFAKRAVEEESTYLQDSQMIGALLGGSMHVVYVLVFAICNVGLLLWFNILISLPVFITAFILSYRGKLKAPPLIGTIEVTVHQVMAVLLLGQDTNFHVLLFCLVPVGILFYKWKVSFFVNSSLALILFLAILWFDTGQFIMYRLPANTIKIIRAINSVGLFTIVGVIIFYYINLNKILYYKQKATSEKFYQSNLELNSTIGIVNKQKERIEIQRNELASTLENLERTQNQLIESEKMAALGGLVAGVAHEINTPVGIGITAISSLQEGLYKMSDLYKENEISRKDFKEFLELAQDATLLIQKNLERTDTLVQSFKQVSTDQVTEQQREFTFKDYLEDILISFRPKFNERNIAYRIECDDKLILKSFPGVYAQIITNLLSNSVKHGFFEKENGVITIRVEVIKENLNICYNDNGAGISKKDLPHIFEPFYTSDQHRGPGLGLNIIYNLVRQKLHGNIVCESVPGAGVKFIIDVPINEV